MVIHELLAQAEAEAAPRLMAPWAAYLFASRVIRKRLGSDADAGEGWALRRTWASLGRQYDLVQREKIVPAKLVYRVARSSADSWLVAFVRCPTCKGEGAECTICDGTGKRWTSEPLDKVLAREPSYRTDDLVIARVLLAEAMRQYEDGTLTIRSTNRLNWLLVQLSGGETQAEAYEDYQFRDW